MNTQLLKVVYEDIIYLQSEWTDISDEGLRRNSTVLRSLLLHKNLQKAWNELRLNGRLLIRSTNFIDTYSFIPVSDISLGSIGGALFNKAQVAHALSLKRGFTQSEITKMGALGPDPFKDGVLTSIDKFCEGIVLVVDGVPFCRREIIDFVANKLGAAHFDQSRTEKQRALDSILDRVIMNGKDIIFYELLSIGQTIAKARHIRGLLVNIKYVL